MVFIAPIMCWVKEINLTVPSRFIKSVKPIFCNTFFGKIVVVQRRGAVFLTNKKKI